MSHLVLDSGANNNPAGGGLDPLIEPGCGVEASSGVQSLGSRVQGTGSELGEASSGVKSLGSRVPDADRDGPDGSICSVSVASRHVARRRRQDEGAGASGGGGAEDKLLKAAAAADADPLLIVLLAASIPLRPTPRLASTPGLQYSRSRPRAACATGRMSPITLPAGGAPGLRTRLPVEQ